MDMVIRWCLMMTTLVYLSVRSQRLVVNTTCLELAKPSNQQRRLSCDKPEHYHCLIDDSHTKEFEMCRGWAWIPEGIYQYSRIKLDITFSIIKSFHSPMCLHAYSVARSNTVNKLQRKKLQMTVQKVYEQSHNLHQCNLRLNNLHIFHA